MIVFYNNKKRIILPVSNNKDIWSFDPANKSIAGLANAINYKWGKMINTINHKMFIFENTFFEKITFKGKGFKLTSKKKTNFIHFLFGHSHMKVVFIQKKIKMRRLSKYKYLFKSKYKYDLKDSMRTVSGIRPLNIFTKRGLRISRQVVFKRKGKKSTYV